MAVPRALRLELLGGFRALADGRPAGSAQFWPQNAKLRADRGIGFEDIVQREDYVYLVPFAEDEHTVFLKTIIPSRKATKQYLGEESDEHEN